MTTTRRIIIVRELAHCPHCNLLCKRHSIGRRKPHDFGVTRPTRLEITYSKHYCPACGTRFNVPMSHLVEPGSHYTNRVRFRALEMMLRQGLTLAATRWALWKERWVKVPESTLHEWWMRELTREVA